MFAMMIGPLFTFLDDALKRAFPDKTERDKIQAALQGQLLQADVDSVKAQLNVNAEEAKSEHVFVSGWRPFIGWVCGASFGWTFVVQPLASFACATFNHPVDLPALDMSQMMPVLLGMLGLGGLRSFEKFQGVNKKR